MFDSTNTQLIEFTGGQYLYLLSQLQKFDNTWVLKISRMSCIVKRRNISRVAFRRRDHDYVKLKGDHENAVFPVWSPRTK